MELSQLAFRLMCSLDSKYQHSTHALTVLKLMEPYSKESLSKISTTSQYLDYSKFWCALLSQNQKFSKFHHLQPKCWHIWDRGGQQIGCVNNAIHLKFAYIFWKHPLNWKAHFEQYNLLNSRSWHTLRQFLHFDYQGRYQSCNTWWYWDGWVFSRRIFMIWGCQSV